MMIKNMYLILDLQVKLANKKVKKSKRNKINLKTLEPKHSLAGLSQAILR